MLDAPVLRFDLREALRWSKSSFKGTVQRRTDRASIPLMRLLIVSPYFPPQRGAASVRLWSIAQQAAQSGIETDVLTITKESDQIAEWSDSFDGTVYEISPKTPGYLQRLRTKDQHHRVMNHEDSTRKISRPIIHSALASLRDRTGVYSSVRMPDLTDHWVEPAIEWANKHQRDHGHWDAVISSCGPYTAHLVAMRIKQSQWANAWVADFRDLWTANHAYSGLFPWTVRERKLERLVLEQCDAITTVSPPLAHWISKRTRTPVKVIYNGYGQFNEAEVSNQTLAGKDSLNLVYTGQLYPKYQDASAILRALKSINDSGNESGRHITLTVAGASSEAWRKLAVRIGAESIIELLGEVSHQRALELQRRADALVAFEWRDPAAGVLTNKLFEYIAAGPLVLLTGRPGPMAKILHESGRGIHLGYRPDDVLEALDSLVHGNLLIPEPNLEHIKQMSRLNQSKELIRLCEQISSGAP